MGEAQENDCKALLYSKKGSFQNNNTATWAERSRFNEWWDCQNSDCKENIPTYLSEFFLRANPISKSSFSKNPKMLSNESEMTKLKKENLSESWQKKTWLTMNNS